MKILHTSDWHLGHVLYGYDRTDEQADFLRQLANIVRDKQPDAMVVTGDIYHYSNPSASTQRMYTDGLLAIRQACPTMAIIVTAGNHDSPSRLEVDSNLWAHLGVHVVGRIERAVVEDVQGQADEARDCAGGDTQRQRDAMLLDRHIIEVCDAAGQPIGIVAAVPHVYPQNFPALGEGCPRDERQAHFFQALLDRVKERNTGGLPVVLTAHLAVTGSSSRGHDESVGGMEWVPLADLGQGYDYLALGHIHCPQDVPGSDGKARYCGTPLAVSFDEDYVHSVSIVEVEHERYEPSDRSDSFSQSDPFSQSDLLSRPDPFSRPGPCGKLGWPCQPHQPALHAQPRLRPKVETIEIKAKWPLRTLPAQPEPLEKALNALSRYPIEARHYIRLQVLTEGTYLPADCMEQARSAIADKACRLCLIKTVRREVDNAATADLPDLSLEEFRQTTPLEIARRFYQEHEGEEMGEEFTAMMQEAIRRIEERAKT